MLVYLVSMPPVGPTMVNKEFELGIAIKSNQIKKIRSLYMYYSYSV